MTVNKVLINGIPVDNFVDKYGGKPMGKAQNALELGQMLENRRGIRYKAFSRKYLMGTR